jgi:FdhD protein
MTPEAAVPLPRLRWRTVEGVEPGQRITAEETPVAIVHDGSTTAVMMATPTDLEDFGVGFSLSEGVIDSPSDIRAFDVVYIDLGIELRMWLTAERSSRMAARRRRLVGPTGCGLCGVESLEEAAKVSPSITKTAFAVTGEDLLAAMSALTEAQPLSRATRAVHAAALWRRDQALIVREDVGRHNALDKLIGATATLDDRSATVLLLTSRVSVEMVQKAAVLGAPILCAVSAPTALAVRTAEEVGLTLVGVARSDGLEVFTHIERVQLRST